ncbi:hypothetical protein PENTCL1PPCAC_8810 [Pristionchus entomophagus]|uniref:Glycine N-acyltransferase-like protein n=1 Tax=Pristionchus entomophagus TaxID=358040 RepID=A0AAV5SVD2_9BILA|nr:hypothetical protein PENTCL1PPCAC_8810 [Pristionchus entomophagus]
MRIFAYPSDDPYYVFFIEDSKYQYPHVQVRPPTAGHNSVLLKESLSAVLKMLTSDLEKHGQLLLETDKTVRAMFFELQSDDAQFDTVYSGDFYPYYMDEEQKEKIVQMEFEAPEGFRIDAVDIARDYDKMHAVWPYRASATP